MHKEVLEAKATMRHFITLMVQRKLAQGWRQWLATWLPDREERMAQRREQERIALQTARAKARQAQLERIKRLREQQMLAKYQEDMKMNESMLSLAKTGPDAARLLARREAIENRAAAERSKRKDS